MGLDVSHGCWTGAYSAFHHWRKKLCEVAGYGNIDERVGFGGTIPWPDCKDDALVLLLHHSDCDGELRWQDCNAIADGLSRLLPALEKAGDGGGHIHSYAGKTRQFIEGLRKAANAQEDVEFF